MGKAPFQGEPWPDPPNRGGGGRVGTKAHPRDQLQKKIPAGKGLQGGTRTATIAPFWPSPRTMWTEMPSATAALPTAELWAPVPPAERLARCPAVKNEKMRALPAGTAVPNHLKKIEKVNFF